MLSMLLGVYVVSACGPPLPESGSDPATTATVSFQPSTDSAHVFAVTHVHVRGSGSGSDPVFLFQGAVSGYYLGKLKLGEIPSTLAARQIPTASFREAGELVVAPLQALDPGSYSLVAASGLLTEFQVTSALPLLSRLWPPPETPGGLRYAVYCAPEGSALPSVADPLLFAPRQLSVTFASGIDEAGLFSDRCRHFSSNSELTPGELTVPPPVYGGWALGPALFAGASIESGAVLSCGAAEVTFGPGCAQVADDRVVVRAPPSALLWVVNTERGAFAQVTVAGALLTVSGLEPDRDVRLWGDSYDLSGDKRSFDLVVHTEPARERLVLNEVLADALGPEPQSEWLELVNDGTLPVDLSTYSLQDSGGRVALPHTRLSAKEYALLVREDYVPNSADEAPPPSARLIRLPSLGKSGLSNAGERLSLVDATGLEQSVLPPLKGAPGQSLARHTPSSADDDPQSFSFGVPTPGYANDRGKPVPMR